MILLDSLCNSFNISFSFGLIAKAIRDFTHFPQPYDWRSASEANVKHMDEYINPKDWSYERIKKKDKNILVSGI